MKLLISALLFISMIAQADDGITSNHQVNPAHSFQRLICFETKNHGLYGYVIVIQVPNGQDALAQIYFNRLGDKRVLVASWGVKYILAPNVYATFSNQFQKMDISKGPDDLFSLVIQLHSGNGKGGVFNADFKSPSLLGMQTMGRFGLTGPNEKSMSCKFTK